MIVKQSGRLEHIEVTKNHEGQTLIWQDDDIIIVDPKAMPELIKALTEAKDEE